MKTDWKKVLGIEGKIALLAIFSIAAYLLAFYLFRVDYFYSLIPLYIVLSFGGGYLVVSLLKELFKGNFGSDLLAGLSIVTSVILEEYLAGSLVVLMLSGGQALERYAVSSASKMLEVIAKRAPAFAYRKRKDVIEKISPEEIAIGDNILLPPHDICPVDGTVLEGSGVMDESYLTGEPFMIAKAPGSEVISGGINGESSLVILATRKAKDSRFAKIMQVMSESAQKRPRMRRLADQLGAWYTPFAIIIALMASWFSSDPVRFLAVLVIATPCPLLLAIPVAIIGSISVCARQGILIKDPACLEQINQCKTMIFDKTGTLTYGRPNLVEEYLFNGFDKMDVLKLVASLENYSKHPLASAILEKAEEKSLEIVSVDRISEPKGQGLKGVVLGHEVIITSRKNLNQIELKEKPNDLPEFSGLECLVVIDGKLAAHYCFRDAPRSDSRLFIEHLSSHHNIEKVMLISGDRQQEVYYLAEVVGIKEVYASKSPEEKVQLVEEETKKTKTAYLGDGINDAPALLAATVGIAFGKGSDITAEASGVVIMDSSLEKVDQFIHLSQRMRKIALQSAIGGMAFSVVGMGFAAFGFLSPVLGAIFQEVIDIFAILNALRTIKKPENISDIPKK